MLKARRPSAGAGQPLKTLIEPLGNPGTEAQLSGGEKTTITLRSSVMWWNLWAVPAGT